MKTVRGMVGLPAGSRLLCVYCRVVLLEPTEDATMKRFLILGCLFVCLGFSACQCSNKPDVGPVEDASVEQAEGPRALV